MLPARTEAAGTITLPVPPPVDVTYLFPLTSSNVVTVKFVPVAFVNVKLVSVELDDQNCVVEAPATENW